MGLVKTEDLDSDHIEMPELPEDSVHLGMNVLCMAEDLVNLFQDLLKKNLHVRPTTSNTVWVLRIPRPHTDTRAQTPELHHQLSHPQLSHKVTSDTAHVLHNPVNVLPATTGAHTSFHDQTTSLVIFRGTQL